jgi:hypothetical protein
MPAAIPVIAAFASGAAGAVIAGTATFVQFATVAGAVLSGVGALTGEKDLMKIGAVMSIGGALAGGLSSLAGTEAASAGAAAGGAGEVVSRAADSQAANAALGMDAAGASTAEAATAPVTSAAPGGASLMDRAAQAPGAGAAGTAAGEAATSPLTQAAPIQPATPVGFNLVDGKLVEAAQGLTSNDLSSWWEKARRTGSGVAAWMEKNPNLMKVGGEMLSAMYGPQAEQMDFQKSLYERSRANLNSPISMRYKTGSKP